MKINKTHSQQILDKITLGWNLGNFLDAHSKDFCWQNSKSKSVNDIVNLWKNPTFNLACLDSLKNVGINCIRIPITWCNFIDITNKKIGLSPEFASFLKNIIDEAIKKDYIVIIDMHHDDQTWLKVSCSHNEFRKICKQYRQLWEIIAYEFKDYSQNLIFEGMNEVIDRSDPDHFDWVGNKKIFFKRLYRLYKIFVKSSRRFSQQNKDRILMVPPYGAQVHKIAIKNLKLPKDKNIIVDLHFYSRHTDVEYYEKKFKHVEHYLIDKNIPVLLGEIGAKKDCENPIEVISVYKHYMDSLNIKCVLWDNGSSRKFIDRKTGKLLIDLKNLTT